MENNGCFKMFPTYINLCATGTYGLAAQDIILRQKQEKGTGGRSIKTFT